MSGIHLATVLRQLRRAAGDAGPTDGTLLERFVADRDEAALELLLWRHGAMVMGVCRRLLGHEQDAEDAFQATFLVLARKAGSIGKREALGSFLYKVAYRIALRARAAAARRPGPLPAGLDVAGPGPAEDLLWRDLRPALDEEVNRLPEKYRAVVVHCYLEGKTNEEAARCLGCPRGTVAIRLKRARDLLRTRLTRRGLTLSAGLAGVLGAAVPAPVSAALVRATLALAVGKATGAASSVALAEGVLQTMFLSKMKTAGAALVLVVGLLGAGTSALLSRAPATEPGGPKAVGPRPAAKRVNPSRNDVKVPSQRDGTLAVVGTELKKGEEGEPGEVIAVREGGELRKYRRLREGDRVEEGQLLARLDDRLAREEVAIKKARIQAAEADHRAAVKTKDEAIRRYEGMIRALRRVDIVEDDLRAARLTAERYKEEEAARAARVRVAEAELRAAETVLSMCEVRSSVAGVIRTIYRQRGEAVKKFEPLFLVRVDEPAARPAPGGKGRGERQEVPVESEGKLIFLGTDVRAGEKVPPGKVVKAEVAFLAVEVGPDEKVPVDQQVVIPGDTRKYRRWKKGDELVPGKLRVGRQTKSFRKLEVGEKVEDGQLLGLVNSALAVDDVDIKIAKLDAADAERKAAGKTRDEAQKRWQGMERARRLAPGSVADDDLRIAKLAYERYQQELVARAADVKKAQRELSAALTVLKMHEIRGSLTGVVRAIYKHRGEAVRNLEPVLRIEAEGK